MQIYCLTFKHPTNFQTHCWKLVRWKKKSMTLALLHYRHDLKIQKRAFPVKARMENSMRSASVVQLGPDCTKWSWAQKLWEWKGKATKRSFAPPGFLLQESIFPINFMEDFSLLFMQTLEVSVLKKWVDRLNIMIDQLSLDINKERGVTLRESFFLKG
jgi:hypothetical protein